MQFEVGAPADSLLINLFVFGVCAESGAGSERVIDYSFGGGVLVIAKGGGGIGVTEGSEGRSLKFL